MDASTLTSPAEERIRQARVLWDKGWWDSRLSSSPFETYLNLIPEIPEWLLTEDERFPDLVLVDARLPLTAVCHLLNVRIRNDERAIRDADPEESRTEKIYWMRCQDGRKNWNKSAHACRAEFDHDEYGLTAMEGLAYYVQKPGITQGHLPDLPASILKALPGSVISFGVRYGASRISWRWAIDAEPNCGSASRMA